MATTMEEDKQAPDPDSFDLEVGGGEGRRGVGLPARSLLLRKALWC